MYDPTCRHDGHHCQCDPDDRPRARKPRARRRTRRDDSEARMLAGMEFGQRGLNDYDGYESEEV